MLSASGSRGGAGPGGEPMAIDTQAYLRALHPLDPPPVHLSDEDAGELLNREMDRSKVAQRAAKTRKRKKQEKQHD